MNLANSKLCQIVAIPVTKRINSNNNIFFYVRTWTQPKEPKEADKPKERTWKVWLDEKVDWAGDYWEKLSNEPEKSLKGRIYSYGNRIMDRIDADEWFLKEISGPSKRAMIIYPADQEKSAVEDRLCALIKYRTAYHAKYRYICFGMIPFSIAAGIMPGPNVFLAYNLFRLYCHDKALTGANRLMSLEQNKQFDYVADQTLQQILKDAEEPLGSDTMKRINNAYTMPPYFLHDIKRTRKQILHTTASSPDKK